MENRSRRAKVHLIGVPGRNKNWKRRNNHIDNRDRSQKALWILPCSVLKHSLRGKLAARSQGRSNSHTERPTRWGTAPPATSHAGEPPWTLQQLYREAHVVGTRLLPPAMLGSHPGHGPVSPGEAFRGGQLHRHPTHSS